MESVTSGFDDARGAGRHFLDPEGHYHPGGRGTDKVIFGLIALILFAGSGLLLLVASVFEIRSYRSRINKIESSRPGKTKTVVVHPNLGLGRLVFQASPFLASAPIMVTVFYTYFADGYTTSVDDIFGSSLTIIALGLITRVLSARSLRRHTYAATEEGIESVRLGRNGPMVTESIRWDEVTKVDLYDILPDGLGIDGPQGRLIVPRNAENLEPLFDIIRRRVPQNVIRKSAYEYIATSDRIPVLSIPPRPSDSSVTMTHPRSIKAFFVILSGALVSVILGAYLFAPRTPGVSDFVPNIIAAGLGLFLAVVLLELFFSHFELSDAGIRKHAFWGKKTFIPWGEVDSIIYIRALYGGDEYRVRSAGKTMYLPLWLNGIHAFGRLVVAHVPPDKWATAKLSLINLLESEERLHAEAGSEHRFGL